MRRKNLTLIDLDQNLPGYRQFISCWVWQAAGLTFVVDPGPRATAGTLIRELACLGLTRLDYVLLTHIHLDHAGGTAEILAAHPEARVYCHEAGVPHMLDPAKLWQGSLKVLGHVAKVYGEMRPIPQASLVTIEELARSGITVIPAPGHAPHHACFLHDGVLYAGESFGTRAPLASGKPYLRPATPPRFFYDVAVATIDRLIALDPAPTAVALAHYGLVEDVRVWGERAKTQLALWIATALELCAAGSADLESRMFAAVMERDPLYGQGRFDELDEDIKRRERHFLGNTLDGILGYLKDQSR